MTPPDKDIDRIAETIWLESNGKIIDRDTFDLHFDGYMGDLNTKQDSRIRERTFKELREQHPEVKTTRIFSEAGGKDLKRDQQKTAKEVVTTEKEYRKKGAGKVDLKDYDTKQPAHKKKRYGSVGGKVVEVRGVYVTYKGKRSLRYRDINSGRFASIKHRKQ